MNGGCNLELPNLTKFSVGSHCFAMTSTVVLSDIPSVEAHFEAAEQSFQNVCFLSESNVSQSLLQYIQLHD